MTATFPIIDDDDEDIYDADLEIGMDVIDGGEDPLDDIDFNFEDL